MLDLRRRNTKGRIIIVFTVIRFLVIMENMQQLARKEANFLVSVDKASKAQKNIRSISTHVHIICNA